MDCSRLAPWGFGRSRRSARATRWSRRRCAFREKGFEQTTVAEIAAAAGMSTRTFFLHFPAKEDVLLVNHEARAELGVAALAAAEPGETVADALARAVGRMVADTWDKDLHSDLAATRARLVATEPALQARVLQRLLATQVALTGALRGTHPELDAADAAAVVGAALGAVSAAAEAALRNGADPAQVRAAMLRAPRTAARHLTSRTALRRSRRYELRTARSSRCIPTSVERSRMSARLPGSTGSRAITCPSPVVTQKHT